MSRNDPQKIRSPSRNKIKFSKTEGPQKHIQINLSKEFFATMTDSGDHHQSLDEDEEHIGIKNEPSNRDNIMLMMKEDSLESDIALMSAVDSSPSPKGIIKKMDSRKPDSILSTSPNSKSPKKVRISEPKRTENPKVPQSITEIEGIRLQLKNMIDVNHANDNPDFDLIHRKDESHVNLEFKRDIGLAEGSMEASDTLQGLLMSYTPSPLQIGESDANKVPGFGMNKQDIFSQRSDDTLLIEMLKGNLEREEQRRKHCENQIQYLQKKILEEQQQLAVAVATDKKKAIMIEQLDTTLARVVEGWKNHEADRLGTIERLKKENTALRKSQNKQQEILAQFENELSQAVESITKEQARAKTAEEEKQAEVQKHENEKNDAFELLVKEKEIANNLSKTIDILQQENENVSEKIATLEENSAKDRESWMQERFELENETEHVRHEYQDQIDHLRNSASSCQKDYQKAVATITELQHEKQRTDIELDASLREKESLKMEIGLLEARFQAVKTKQESEQQGKLQEEFNRRINFIQEEIIKTEAELKNAHKQQILQLNQKHKEDLEKQAQRYREELNKKDANLQKISEHFQKRLSEADNEITALNDAKRDLESQRQELNRRLRSLIQQHMQEAVSLISLESNDQSQHHVTQPRIQDPTMMHEQIRSMDGHFQENENRNSMGKDFQGSIDIPNHLWTTNAFNIFEHANSNTNVTDSKSQTGSLIQKDQRIMARMRDGDESIDSTHFGLWSKLQQKDESPDKPSLFGNSVFDMSTSTAVQQSFTPTASTGSLSSRQERFQSGLQDLSDKLKISSQIENTGKVLRPNVGHSGGQAQPQPDCVLKRFDINVQTKEPGYASLQQIGGRGGGIRADYTERTADHDLPASKQPWEGQEDTWSQVQALLKSKMQEVDSDVQTNNDAESTLKEHTIKEDAFDSSTRNSERALDEQIEDQENRQVQLTHFIQQLLNKSPGNPTEDDQYQQSRQDKDATVTANFNTLPFGSDLVSKDQQHESFQTPPKSSRSSQLSQAFKKSVLKEKRSLGVETMKMNSKGMSPRKSPSKTHSIEESKKKEQLEYFMKALGMNTDVSMQDLDGMIKLMQNAQKSSREQRKDAKLSTLKQNTSKPAKISSHRDPSLKTFQANKHQGSKSQQGHRQNDVFNRLQKVYGSNDELQLGQRSLSGQGRSAAPRQLSRVQGSQSFKTQGNRVKESRKATISPRNVNDKHIQAWK